jgi:uncharacterized protein (TIGR03437 family)
MYALDSPPTVVNAASYAGPQLAPGSLAAFFGQNLAVSTASAESVDLPEELAGTRLVLRSDSGTQAAAPLLCDRAKPSRQHGL